ncbi:MAG TPA: YhcH/YjgK/YiaL family protein [Myxococcales bacterium]|jgi:YhcH/YjgK/YiaL family protein
MILVPLAELRRYASLHPLFPAAFDWLDQAIAGPFRPGRHPIREPSLFANADEGTTSPPGERRFESHRRFIDIQVEVEGGEFIDWVPASELKVEQDFAPDADTAFYEQPRRGTTRLLVPPRHAAVFLPGEAHRCLIQVDSRPARFRKYVVKVEA